MQPMICLSCRDPTKAGSLYLWKYICYLLTRAVTIVQRIVFVLIRLDVIVDSPMKAAASKAEPNNINQPKTSEYLFLPNSFFRLCLLSYRQCRCRASSMFDQTPSETTTPFHYSALLLFQPRLDLVPLLLASR